jgi:hypothetical protein
MTCQSIVDKVVLAIRGIAAPRFAITLKDQLIELNYLYYTDIFSLFEKRPQIPSPNFSIVLVGIALICYGEKVV